MRAVAYSIRSFEKEPLAIANRKKHEITLISNGLCLETAEYATGKQAVIISDRDQITPEVISRLAQLGVKFIAVRSSEIHQVDKQATSQHNMKLAVVSPFVKKDGSTSSLNAYYTQCANETIQNLDTWQNERCEGDSCSVAKDCGSHIISNELRTRLNA
ncbi:D-lactate dehydrogenase [Arcticibacter pallidicorallinus]|uniref:D-lactate dehydrogenase n=1 Tax=Arcticibacter pallidicorallinus TaxID=1259464 RepID=A0A2T0U919_9SPHI|nr:lactate dehydrogenase [Arcticibacter pallidicorallinus]PRY54372.1 D-lactate dehydrogenase [Arcticibacter pallidicorallinus]